MGLGRKIGKAFRGVARTAKEIDRGMNMVFGRNRTRPGDDMSARRAGKRAGITTKRMKQGNKAGISNFKESGEAPNYFNTGQRDQTEDEDRQGGNPYF
jgi:hypothetical protein